MGLKYVDNSLSTGKNDGSSWADAWRTLDQGVAGASGGDILYVSGGPTGTTQTYSLTGSLKPPAGTAGNPVTFKIGQDSAHNGTAIFSGSGVFLDANLASATHNSYITLSGDAGDGLYHFKCTGFDTILNVNNGSNHTLNWVIEYFDFGNLGPNGFGTLNGVGKFEIGHSTWYCDSLSGESAITFGFIGSGYDENKIHHNVIYGPGNLDGTGIDFIQGGGTGISVYNNRFEAYLATYTGTQHQDGWQALTGSYLKCYNNEFVNIASYSVFLEAFYGDFSHVRIYNNITRTTSSLVQSSGAPRGIVCVPSGGVFSQIGRWPVFDDIVICNNLVSDLGGTHAAVQLQNQNGSQFSTFTNCYAYNNIGVNGGSMDFDPSVTVANNITLTSAAASGIFQSYADQSNSNDFHLTSLATSLINHGTDAASVIGNSLDKDGATRTLWDIGPYYYMGGESPVGGAPRSLRKSGVILAACLF